MNFIKRLALPLAGCTALAAMAFAGVVRTSQFQILSVSPRHIFTPNGDGVNDVFTITFDDPDDSPITSARIFDLSGARIADMSQAAGGNTLRWDGRISHGGYVHAGIYLYRVEVEGHVWSGSVVVAR